jgi:hypothetical protein
VLREYHEKKGGSLPAWLRDSRTPATSSKSARERYGNEDNHRLSENTRQRQRLWDVGDEPEPLTARERERQRLRDQVDERDSYRSRHEEDLAEHSRQRERSRDPNARYNDARSLNRSATTVDSYSHEERQKRHDRDREGLRGSDQYEAEKARMDRMRSMRELSSNRHEPPSEHRHRPSRRELDDYEHRQERPRARSPMYEHQSEHRIAVPSDRERLRGPRRAPPRQKVDSDMGGGYF